MPGRWRIGGEVVQQVPPVVMFLGEDAFEGHGLAAVAIVDPRRRFFMDMDHFRLSDIADGIPLAHDAVRPFQVFQAGQRFVVVVLSHSERRMAALALLQNGYGWWACEWSGYQWWKICCSEKLIDWIAALLAVGQGNLRDRRRAPAGAPASPGRPGRRGRWR